MTEDDSSPQGESKPIEETTQPEQETGKKEAEIPALPPIVQSFHTETQQPDSTESEEETDRKQDEAISSLADQTKWIQDQTTWIKRQAVGAFVLGAITLAVLIYHGWIMRKQSDAMTAQTEIMKGQLDAMNSGSAQTQQMVDATQKQADASTTQAQASLAQAEAAKRSVTAAEHSARAAERGANIAQQSFYVGDRPYIAANALLDKFEVGTVPTVQVLLMNAGKTPAMDVQVSAIVNVDKLPKPDLRKYRRMSKAELIASQKDSLPYGSTMPEGSRTFLAADGKLLVEIRGPQMTAARIEDLKNHREFLFVWGFSVYKDGLGKNHKLRFCMFYNPKEDMFVACPTHNSTN